MCSRCCLLSIPITLLVLRVLVRRACSCDLPGHFTSLSVGLGVCRAFAMFLGRCSRWSGRGALRVGAVLGLRVGCVFSPLSQVPPTPLIPFLFWGRFREFVRSTSEPAIARIPAFFIRGLSKVGVISAMEFEYYNRSISYSIAN